MLLFGIVLYCIVLFAASIVFKSKALFQLLSFVFGLG